MENWIQVGCHKAIHILLQKGYYFLHRNNEESFLSKVYNYIYWILSYNNRGATNTGT